jgi:hypothetical protein
LLLISLLENALQDDVFYCKQDMSISIFVFVFQLNTFFASCDLICPCAA